MNKKIVGILLSALILATIPVAAGMSETTEEEQKTGLFNKTRVVGLILGARTTGAVTSFLALRVRYVTTSLFGEAETGVIMFQRISFVGKFTGHMGRFFVSGSFLGTI